jgi:hypothetical protein
LASIGNEKYQILSKTKIFKNQLDTKQNPIISSIEVA